MWIRFAIVATLLCMSALGAQPRLAPGDEVRPPLRQSRVKDQWWFSSRARISISRMWTREAAPVVALLYSPSTISRRPNSPRTQCGSQCGWLPSTKSTVISSIPSTP